MPLYKCAKCGCVENTALGLYWTREIMIKDYDWTGLEEYRGKPLCSECAPAKYIDGTPTSFGKWHNRFPKEPFDDTKHEATTF